MIINHDHIKLMQWNHDVNSFNQYGIREVLFEEK